MQLRDRAPPRLEAEVVPASEPVFEAKEDLLLVEWKDGSKLNFRWKVKDGDLLLTDHEGRISKLRRIVE